MKVTLSPGHISGRIAAIPSKSHLHRLLICASFAERPTLLRLKHTNAEDIKATVDCLSALGAAIETRKDCFMVTPVNMKQLPKKAILPCGESGSTLRFMLPVVCALGVSGEFKMSGRLPERPLAPLDTELTRHGIRLWKPESNTLCCEGKLTAGNYTLPGNISSQYISGLLMALPLTRTSGKSEVQSFQNEISSITIEEPIESADYIAMTIKAMKSFGYAPIIDQNQYKIHSNVEFTSPREITVEGDWSNAAFWICAGAMPNVHGTFHSGIEVIGLNKQSVQGDREICAILERMGAQFGDSHYLRVSGGKLRGVEIDARAIPDLVPVLSAVAAVSEGETVIKNAQRLRLKESDRLAATAQVLNSLGAKITEEPDGLRIRGVEKLTGGVVDSWGDHRIPMTAAVASLVCEGSVTITGAQAVQKSYPAFWDDLRALGKEVFVYE